MADMNSEEVDAKIGASEARTDSKFATVIARLDALTTEMREMRVEMSNIKISIILTVIASTLAIIFGVAGFNASLLNNMLASFDSGKERGQWQSEMRRQAVETDLVVARVRKQLEANEALQKQITTEFEQIKQGRASGWK